MKVAINNFTFNKKYYEVGMPIDPEDLKEIEKACPKYVKTPTKKEIKLIKKHFGKMVEKYEGAEADEKETKSASKSKSKSKK